MRKFVLPLAVAIATVAPVAHAFCGFYVSDSGTQLLNNATQVAMMREGTRTVLSMENNYEGPPDRFAMVVPVPVVLQKENVKTLPRALFEKLEQLDSPRLVEYWEQDPCLQPSYDAPTTAAMPQALAKAARGSAGPADFGVRIEAQFSVGEYEILILSAENATGLDAWLRQEKYNIPAGAAPYFRPYIQAGSKFFVAKVDPTKVTFEHGQAQLSPLRFHYDSETFTLPVRLGLINSGGKQDLVVHILARGKRYEVANYPNVTIPTNLDVDEKTKGEFGTFYAGLFDATLEKNPGAIVTEYSWDASSCDPCPGPALSGQDFATLGSDVLTTSMQTQAQPQLQRGMRGMSFGGGFTLTRLHARYSKEALGADLVFRAAPAIVGGREQYGVSSSRVEHGAVASSYNNFQARYAIRHPWEGKIECDKPRRGVWGGPPSGQTASPTRGATNLAFAPRSQNFQLSNFVREDIPELGFLRTSPTPTPVPAPSTAPAAPTAPTASSSGCAGCAVQSGAAPLGLLAALPLLIFWRRRRR